LNMFLLDCYKYSFNNVKKLNDYEQSTKDH
jgi:hypothetical protein